MINYSPNMLKTFKSCPKKYFLKYVEGITVPQKAVFFEKGKKIHALAHYYLRGDDISRLENTLKQSEKEVWENLKKNIFFQMKYFNSEYNLSCKVGDFWIGGRLDAVVLSNNANCSDKNNPASHPTSSKPLNCYYILDYKTGSIPPNPEYDYQTMIYLLSLYKFLKQNNNEFEIKFVYIDLKNNQNIVIDFDETRKSEYEKIIISTCKQIENKKFISEYSKKCDFCEFKKVCLFCNQEFFDNINIEGREQ